MTKEELFHIIGEVDEQKVAAAGMSMNRKKSSPLWVKWCALAACLCLAIGLTIPAISNTDNPHPSSGGTLIGATEIYPTIMVDGQLYEWRKGAAIRDELPNDCVYYGDLNHVEGKVPTNDSEFVSVFAVSGQIYTIPENNSCAYLCLTTDWLTETVVVFDLVSIGTPADLEIS